MNLGRPRPPRYRLYVLVALTGLIVFAVVNTVVKTARDPEPDPALVVRGYLDQVVPYIQQSTQQGTDLVDIRNNAVALGTDSVISRLERTVSDADAIITSVREVSAPDRLADAHDYLVSAFALRARATRSVQQAILSAADPTQDETASKLLADAALDLGASDRLFTVFKDEAVFQLSDVDTQVSIPDSLVTSSGVWDATGASAFLTALRASASPTPIVDAQIVLVTTDPGSLRTQDGVSVLPPDAELAIQLVVANAGNRQFDNVSVVATLEFADGGADDKREFVSLGAGQQQTIALSGWKLPENEPFVLRVEVEPVEGEANIMNNVYELPLLVITQP